MRIIELENSPLPALRKMAGEMNIPKSERMKKENLIIKDQAGGS